MSPEESNSFPSNIVEKLFHQEPHRHELANGLTVVHQAVPANPMASVQVWVRTGSIHEFPNLGSGLSHFLEHMMFKGTSRRNAGKIPQQVQELGGSINAYTAFDRTVYYIDLPTEFIGEALDILGDMMQNALLPEDEIEREKQVILREIDMAVDDPDRELSRSMMSTAFRIHPFRHPVIGHQELFEQLQGDDLRRYYRERYVPENMVLVITGDFDEVNLQQKVEQTFGTAKRRGLNPIVVPEEPRQLAYRENRREGPFQICRGGMSYKIPSLRHRDAPALDLLAAILGTGNSSILREELRNRLSLVHHIEAAAWNPGTQGLFWIQYSCEPGAHAKVEDAIRATLQQILKNGIPESALSRAKHFAILGEIQSRKTVNALASRLGLAEAIVGDLGYPRFYLQSLESLTTGKMQQLMAEWLREDRLCAVTIEAESAQTIKPFNISTGEAAADFSEVKLSNGARLLMQPDKSLPRVYMRFGGLGGPLYEDPRERGITQLMSTLLIRDTQYRSAREVMESLESKGGFISETSGNNTFSLGIEFFSNQCDEGLQILEEAILFPAFQQEAIEREKKIQLAQIDEEMDEIVDYARKSLRRNFFGMHPFGSDPIGESFTVSNLNARQLQAHYERLVLANNAVLTVSGDFDPQKLLPRLEAFLLELPNWSFRPSDQPFTGPLQTGLFTDTMKREQAVTFEAYPSHGICHNDSIISECLDAYLSEMSGPLFQNIREEKNLAYFVSASRLVAQNYGMFYLYAGTQPGKEDDVFAAFEEELDRLRNGDMDPETLQRVRTRMKTQSKSSLQSAGSRGFIATLNALYHKPVEDWKNYHAKVDAITVEQISSFAQQFLHPDKRLRLSVGP